MACRKKKCMRAGPVTKNGFLNFMRQFRKKNCGMSATEATRCGARVWNKMSCATKERYRRMGTKTPKCRRRPRRRKAAGCRKRRKSCGRRRRPRRRRRSCSRPKRRPSACGRKGKCFKMGPVTANGYLNFLRCFRKTHCGLTPNQIIRRGAKAWCRLSRREKNVYEKMACQKTKNKCRRQSPFCRRALRKRKRC